jgi:Domain of unknown function (DUF4424)
MAMRRLIMATAAAVLMATPVSANDSVAEIGAGGLVLGRSDVVSMESETLYLSMDEVWVDYVFRNNAGHDVETVVAFPMPDIDVTPYEGISVPQTEDNFLGFTVEAEGRSIQPELQQRAWADGVDVTDIILGAGLQISPLAYYGETFDASHLSQEMLADLVAWGIVVADFDAATGLYGDPVEPAWTLKSAYWWRMTFPAKADVAVHHSYTPAVGGSAGLFFLTDDPQQPVLPDYAEKYCIDDAFLKGAVRRQNEADPEKLVYTESRLSYILTTGGNWAGPIGKFRMIVDKGSTDNLVSFCGEGVKKTGPTTFEMEKADFWPGRDMHVLFVVAHEFQ